ncbi:type II toxin-antitoxin system VapC family toxin [Chelativorans xinjiangense]|uniref:type II toxin-antitoxin system VapC family toxin n=1 Tax=Chelativorans xinjiangense TaxID=2681485 RepID=UPI0013575A70|nr:type II toxin-antitoxin system VapC family toxin [Chelativorans xinjiangense]
MIVDSSAVVAVILDEPERAAFQALIETTASVGMAAPGLIETSMVLATRRGPAILDLLDEFRREAQIAILPFTETHAIAAREAFLRYGKGRHRAGLNYGDCMCYAVARLEGMPLLFKGDDFHFTDIEPALPRP